MIVRILAEAEAQLDSVRQYLNTQSLGLGGRFLDELEEALVTIASTAHRTKSEKMSPTLFRDLYDNQSC